MRFWKAVAAFIFGITMAAGAARAAVQIEVDVGSQTMRVTTGDGATYAWPVSTARRGFKTPRGTYGVQSLQRMHYSRKYHNSPMPHSIFFAGGYAIHGTYATGSLGRPASHGCVRIAPENAAALYRMVQAEGARISIRGSAPAEGRLYASRAGKHRIARAAPPRPDTPFRGGFDDPSAALGYAPLVVPSFDQWQGDPSGF